MADAATLRKLAALKLAPEQMAGVLELLADMQEADEKRRTKQRERKARSRDNSVTVTGPELDVGVTQSVTETDAVPPKETSPTPPKEITPSTSLRSVSVSAGARDAVGISDAIETEFAQIFWPAYPSKVGKPDALTAFIAARRGLKPKGKPPREPVPLERIMAGLERYVRTKPPDREWLHPATFLNGNRFDDEPASPPASAKPKPHDTIFRALATVALQGDGGGQRAADPDVRRDGDGTADAGDPDPFASIAIPDYLQRRPAAGRG